MAEQDVESALVELGDALKALDQVNPRRLAGRVTEVTGLVVRATIPGVRVGELVYIDRDAMSGPGGAEHPRLQAEVVGFRGDEVVLMPLGEVAGIGPDAVVSPTGRPLACGWARGCWGAYSTVWAIRWTGRAPSQARPRNGRWTGPRPTRSRAGA